MKKNYNEVVADLKKRQLTAKGHKFIEQLADIVCNKKGYQRYTIEYRLIKQRLRDIVETLFLDHLMTLNEVKEVIKNRIEKNTLN